MPQFTVHLGNAAPTRTFYPDDEAAKKGLFEREPVEGLENAITSFMVGHGDVEDGLTEIHHAWTLHHSNGPPAWVHVESSDAELAQDVARAIRRKYSITEDDVAAAVQAAEAAEEAGDPVPEAVADIVVAHRRGEDPTHEVGIGVPDGWVPMLNGDELDAPVSPPAEEPAQEPVE